MIQVKEYTVLEECVRSGIQAACKDEKIKDEVKDRIECYIMDQICEFFNFSHGEEN